MTTTPWRRYRGLGLLLFGMLFCVAIYVPGLTGGFAFDDFPNIVDNPGVQPERADMPSLVTAALSSPSSELKRPVASLSFAANYLATGLAPGPMKVTNLVIHLLNGLVIFMLTRRLMDFGERAEERRSRAHLLAAAVTSIWLLLPINLTAVLYVVQRMESLANLCVVAGLWAYVSGRTRMQEGRGGLLLAISGVLAGSAVGILSKETAAMTPLYAFLIEAVIFRWHTKGPDGKPSRDRRVMAFFSLCLLLPMIASLFWLVPMMLSPKSWATRDFTLTTRLLSETRIVMDYIGWTVFPLPSFLSFYHDDFTISQGILTPVSTLWSMLAIAGLLIAAWVLRRRRPLFTLGISLYFGAHLLTGTVIPLELIYEHRNYFPSLALLLALSGLFFHAEARRSVSATGVVIFSAIAAAATVQTARTADAWGAPLSLAEELARRAPSSPRAQYELGRAYIIDSHYDRHAISTTKAYPPLERAAAMPRSTILPLQALVFFNARLRLPVPQAWWNAMVDKLASRRPGVEDESSLIALTQCMDSGACDLPAAPMQHAYEAAMSHAPPSGRLLSAYADFAWNQLADQALAEDLQRRAVDTLPKEPAHRITLIRFQIAAGHYDAAERSISALADLNFGGNLNDTLKQLRKQLTEKRSSMRK